MPLGQGLGGGEQSCANSPTIKTLGLLEHVVGTVQAPVNNPKKKTSPASFAKRGAALQRLLPLLSREQLRRGEQLGGSEAGALWFL